jgi:uncharacterized membrane protein YqiK
MIVNAYINNFEIKINTDLKIKEFFNEYKYLKFNGKTYRITQIIKRKDLIEAEFEPYNGPIDGDIKQVS